jgi:hypothetical protein
MNANNPTDAGGKPLPPVGDGGSADAGAEGGATADGPGGSGDAAEDAEGEGHDCDVQASDSGADGA